MPRISDHIVPTLLPDLQNAIPASDRADFCVGHFNLRGCREAGDEELDSMIHEKVKYRMGAELEEG